MKGHVCHGQEILFDNGTIYTIKNTNSGWTLDLNGQSIIKPEPWAHNFTTAIIKMNETLSNCLN